MEKCIMENQKTFRSCDFTTNCPKRQAEMEDLAKGIKLEDIIPSRRRCKYCYVEAKRHINFNAKKIIDTINYNHEVLKMSIETVNKLNSIGGLRLFSFGDYMPEQDQDIYDFLSDCRKMGLFVKVITKQLKFIDKFYTEFEDVFSVIHISVDNIGDGVDWKKAKKYRKQYAKVIIRSVILKNEDIEVMDKISDIMTFNHENIKHNVPDSINFKLNKPLMDLLRIKYFDKMCCTTGSCETCKIHCKASNLKNN